MELGEQVFAERYEGGGASRREVETAQQFLPTRLDGLTQCVDRLIAGAFLRKILNGAFEPFSVGTEMLAKILQEGELYLRARPRISGKQGLGQSNTGCLAAARQEQLTQRCQIAFGAGQRRPLSASAAKERPAPFGQIVDQIG